MLAPVLDELHRPAQRPGRERDEQLLGPRVVDLHAEAAAHVGRHHVDLAEVEAELDRDRGPHPGRGLRRGPHGQPVDVGVPAGDRAAALHRLAGAALDGQVEGERVRRGGDGRGRVAVALLHPGADVAGHVLVHQVRGRAGGLDADDGRQHLVVDPDPADRVLGDVAVVGHHERDRLADVVHLAVGQRVLRAAVGQRRVRDQQRQRVGHRRRRGRPGPRRSRPACTPSRSSTSSTCTSSTRAWACGERSTAACSVAGPTATSSTYLPLPRRNRWSSTRWTRGAEQLGRHELCRAPPPAAPTSRCSGSRCSDTGSRRSCRGPRPRSARGSPRGRP